MAILSAANRAAVHARLADWYSGNDAAQLTKPDLRAAVDAADAWVDSNSASYNTALPAAFRTNATARQKALLLTYVILRRFEVI